MRRPDVPSREALARTAARLAELAAACDHHADRREHALGRADFPRSPAHARKVIADLRRRAAQARADEAAAAARIDALESDFGPIPTPSTSTHMELLS